MFKQILCCVDGSQHALKAAETACELARRFDGQITFLTVAKELKPNEQVKRFLEIEHLSGEPQYVLDEYTQEIIAKAKAEAEACGVKKVVSEVKSGHPARTIVDFAEKRGFDCIVLGSRGLGDIEGILLGSVSHKVNTLAKCTVVTVKR